MDAQAREAGTRQNEHGSHRETCRWNRLDGPDLTSVSLATIQRTNQFSGLTDMAGTSKYRGMT